MPGNMTGHMEGRHKIQLWPSLALLCPHIFVKSKKCLPTDLQCFGPTHSTAMTPPSLFLNGLSLGTLHLLPPCLCPSGLSAMAPLRISHFRRPFSIYPLPNSIFCQIEKRRQMDRWGWRRQNGHCSFLGSLSFQWILTFPHEQGW